MSRGLTSVLHWISVQARVAFSTAEAKLYSQVRGLQQMLRLKYLWVELRPLASGSLECISEVDSTACKCFLLRHGVDSLKHLAARTVRARQVVPTRIHRGTTDAA